MLPGVGRGDKAAEQRVRLVRLAVKFWMKLAADVKGVFGQVHDFDQLAVDGIAAENNISLRKAIAVGVIEFVTVAVTLIDDKSAVQLRGARADDELAGL